MIMNKWIVLLWLVFLNALLLLSFNFLFISDEIYYSTYAQQFSISRINSMIELSNKWQWWGYAIMPVIILIRVSYTSILLSIGFLFTEQHINFDKLFKITILADFVFVFAGLAKLVILIFFKQVSTLEDLQFQPFSIMELLNSKSIDPLFVYPLSLLNVFEFAYFLILAWLLVRLIKESNEEHPIRFGKSLKLVVASYGNGLLLWVLVVMFITLNLS